MRTIISPPPDGLELGNLFRRWSALRSGKDWRRAGFDVLRDKPGKILVLGHPAAPGYLFKKYGSLDPRAADEQLEKYASRVAGAALLRDHVARNGLQHVVVPRKWLCELPPTSESRGTSPHLVVVDRHAILDADASAARYRHLSAAAARELLTILFAFRRLDFTARNAPFTRAGTIAFIDTEYVQLSSKSRTSRRRYYERYVDSMLSKHRRLAHAVWDELAQSTRRTPAR